MMKNAKKISRKSNVVKENALGGIYINRLASHRMAYAQKFLSIIAGVTARRFAEC